MISREAFRVFSMFPISTADVVISELSIEDLILERKNQMAATKAITTMTDNRIALFLLAETTSFEITVSMRKTI